jgi:hypothetical protein
MTADQTYSSVPYIIHPAPPTPGAEPQRSVRDTGLLSVSIGGRECRCGPAVVGVCVWKRGDRRKAVLPVKVKCGTIQHTQNQSNAVQYSTVQYSANERTNSSKAL